MGRTKRLRRVLVPTLALTVLVPAPIAEARSQVPSLAGTNVVSASDSTWMSVRLPRPVEISTKPFDNPLIEIDQGGSLAAVILRQDMTKGIEVMFTRADLCSPGSAGRPFDVLNVYVPKAREFPRRVRLPAGAYQLYVLAEGGPTKATIELPGLPGSARLTPDRAADVSSRELPAPTPNDFSATVGHNLGRRGISLVAMEADTEVFSAARFGTCIEPSDNELPEPADGPTCEGGRTAGSPTVVNHLAGGGRKVVLSKGFLGPGSYDHQMHFRSAALVNSIHAYALSLTYATSDRNDDWMYSLSFML